jgi:NAD(P)-dependent dehydrogenase (short-subunit alcohol dehydrogenase family)
MADLGFDGKVAIVTGGGGGLGREHALEFARRGARVVVNDLGGAVDGTGGSVGAAQAVVDEISALGGEAVANGDSVATVEGGEAIVQSALDAFGQVDIVVNNAGILRDKSFHNMTDELITPVIDVHLKGAFYVTLPAWKLFREQKSGAVINTSSNSGLLGNFGQANYGAAKMGLVGFTRVLAAEGAKHGIRANAIAPVAKTRMTEDLLGSMAEQLDPKFVTPVVIYLAHESCPATGQVYSAAGGTIAKFFVGLTQGTSRGADITPETVREDWDAINDEAGYIVPANPAEEFGKLLQNWGVA